MPDHPPRKKDTGLDKLDLSFLAPAQQADEIGRLAHYRVLMVLAQGDSGIVFKAEDAKLERTIALKVMRPEIARNANARERFLREARAAAQIEHDHIIHIFQVGEDRGVPFIAMPFLKGMNLETLLKNKRPLTIPQILRIGREIAKGLVAAHDIGLIHRDIQPAKIWLDAASKGRVKILDFGLARPEQDDSNLTAFGQIIGTPEYMSPEQASGEKLDARSDLFSLGTILYLLCTGKLPFRGNNMMAIVSALAGKEPVPVRQLNPEIPEAFATVIARLMRKKPAERPTARQVVNAIAAIERERMMNQLGEVGDGTPLPFTAPAAPRPKTNPPGPAAATPVVRPGSSPAISAAQVPPAPKPAEAPAGAPPSFNFEESSDSLLSEDELTPRPEDKPQTVGLFSGNNLVPIVAGAMIGLVILLVGAVIVVWRPVPTPEPANEDGIVELAMDGLAGRVLLEQDGKLVGTLQPKRPLKLKPGRYVARPGAKNQAVEPTEFQLEADRRVTVRLRVAPFDAATDLAPGQRPAPLVAPVDAKIASQIQDRWATYLKQPFILTNSVDLSLALIPPGEFLMGDNGPRRGPAHVVRITRPFRIGVHEVTQAQYHQVIGKNPSFFNAQADGSVQHPVDSVHPAEAEDFCKALTNSASEKSLGRRYRLPTEAEWEYAARAGVRTPYVFGDQLGPNQAQIDAKATAAAGQFQPNAWGLYDVHGNVAEWCADRFAEDAYKTHTLDDPFGPGKLGFGWVLRGGAFDAGADANLLSSRWGETAAGKGRGFRVVCEVDEPVPDGFVRIFNGRNLDEWQIKGSLDNWSVENGVLVCHGASAGALMSAASYRNFQLRLEWRCARDCNSGVFLRARDLATHALEIDLLSREGDRQSAGGKAGDASTLPQGTRKRVAASRIAARGAGEWNLCELTLQEDKLTALVNGDTVQTLDVKRLPDVKLVNEAGPIGLESLRGRVEFRDIAIKPLPDTTP